ncbi:MAG: urea ABC transporter ATP-binding protein UrtD [Herbaspirillum sp.]
MIPDDSLPEILLKVVDLTVSFDGFRAIDTLNLSINKNELRVIIGPNGAGKTTLLDMLCGKTRPSSGQIIFKGHELTTMPEYEIVRLGIGRKFQTPSIYEDLSVIENFEISLPGFYGIGDSLFFRRSAVIKSQIERIAGEVFLQNSLKRKAGLLSHGEKQWLEIGMLLMQDPQLLLLDEPVAGMSVRERELTGDLLKRISVRKSLIVIEHDMDFVKQIAHKVTVLHQGQLLCEGTIEEVQEDERVIDVYIGH